MSLPGTEWRKCTPITRGPSDACGFHLHDARATHGLAAMLGAMSDYGKTGAQWTEGAVGLGCRSAAATNGDGAGRSPCLDRDTGIAVAADARLDDRDTTHAGGATGLRRRP